MSYDALIITMAIIGVLSALFFVLGVLADLVLPALAGQAGPRRQATYRKIARRKPH